MRKPLKSKHRLLRRKLTPSQKIRRTIKIKKRRRAMPDIHDMELDARISLNEIEREIAEENCIHAECTFQPFEHDTNVKESYSCDACGKELELPEPDEDTMRGEDR